MPKTDPDQPFHPFYSPLKADSPGLTKREYIATQLACSLLTFYSLDLVPETSVQLADNLIDELNNEDNEDEL